jgi:hypothetical protein
MRVFFTVDVEIWCNGWSSLDARFPSAFASYVYGRTPQGEYGLRYQTRVLRDHGLLGVFYVEPLFAARFGMAPLHEIVGLLTEAQQDTQLHLHPEWVDELVDPMVAVHGTKRPLLRQFDLADQTRLIGAGLKLLQQAGACEINCFRAGSFGFDQRTLQAMHHCGIPYDSSYNAVQHGPDSGVAHGQILTDVYHGDAAAVEFPLTVFDDGFGRLRHAQLGACSTAELESMLWQAAEEERQSFVILSHNFELLSPSKTRVDPVVDRRFRRLCRFLERHGDTFQTSGFRGLGPLEDRPQKAPLRSTRPRTCMRMVEQAWRRSYR